MDGIDAGKKQPYLTLSSLLLSPQNGFPCLFFFFFHLDVLKQAEGVFSYVTKPQSRMQDKWIAPRSRCVTSVVASEGFVLCGGDTFLLHIAHQMGK